MAANDNPVQETPVTDPNHNPIPDLAVAAPYPNAVAATDRLNQIADEYNPAALRTAFGGAIMPWFDTGGMDPDLAAKLVAREQDPALLSLHCRPVSLGWNILARALIWPGALAVIAGAVHMLVIVMTGRGADLDAAPNPFEGVVPGLSSTELPFAAALLFGGLIIAGVGFAIREVGAYRNPLALTEQEARQAEKARVLWRGTYNDYLCARNTEPTTTAESPEARVVAVARLLTEQIRTSPAYQHADLDTMRLDLDRITRDIDLRAYRIWKVREQLTDPGERPVVAEALRERRELETAAADAGWITLIGQVDALTRYRAELVGIEHILADIAAIDRAATRDVDDTVLQLLRDAAGAELDTAQIDQHTQQLTDLREGLQARVTVLRALVDNSTMPTLTVDGSR